MIINQADERRRLGQSAFGAALVTGGRLLHCLTWFLYLRRLRPLAAQAGQDVATFLANGPAQSKLLKRRIKGAGH